MGLKTISKEQLVEMSLVEIAYEFLLENKQAVEFRGLIGEVAQLLNLNEDQVREKIAQFYTDLNVDGRFTCIPGNLWGLKNWYPIEHSIEEISIVPKVKKKKGKKVVEEEIVEGFDPIDEGDDFDDFAEEDVLVDDEEEIDEIDEIEEVEEIEEVGEEELLEAGFEIDEEPIEISLEVEAEVELEELEEEDF